jgi:hypothetical protein
MGTVAHSCNPCYSGGGGLEDYDLRSAQAESWQDPFPINNPGVVVHACCECMLYFSACA